MYVEDNGSAAMLATKRSAGATPEMNLGECVTCMPLPKCVNKAPTLALKSRGDTTRSPNRGISGPQKGLASSKIKKKQEFIPVGSVPTAC